MIKNKYNNVLKEINYDPNKYKKVLFLTYRKTLSKDIYKSFEHYGFKNYLK